MEQWIDLIVNDSFLLLAVGGSLLLIGILLLLLLISTRRKNHQPPATLDDQLFEKTLAQFQNTAKANKTPVSTLEEDINFNEGNRIQASHEREVQAEAGSDSSKSAETLPTTGYFANKPFKPTGVPAMPVDSENREKVLRTTRHIVSNNELINGEISAVIPSPLIPTSASNGEGSALAPENSAAAEEPNLKTNEPLQDSSKDALPLSKADEENIASSAIMRQTHEAIQNLAEPPAIKDTTTNFARSLLKSTRVPLSSDILLGVLKSAKNSQTINGEVPPSIKKMPTVGDRLMSAIRKTFNQPQVDQSKSESVGVAQTTAPEMAEAKSPTPLIENLMKETIVPPTLEPPQAKAWIPLPTQLKPSDSPQESTVRMANPIGSIIPADEPALVEKMETVGEPPATTLPANSDQLIEALKNAQGQFHTQMVPNDDPQNPPSSESLEASLTDDLPSHLDTHSASVPPSDPSLSAEKTKEESPEKEESPDIESMIKASAEIFHSVPKPEIKREAQWLFKINDNLSYIATKRMDSPSEASAENLAVEDSVANLTSPLEKSESPVADSEQTPKTLPPASENLDDTVLVNEQANSSSEPIQEPKPSSVTQSKPSLLTRSLAVLFGRKTQVPSQVRVNEALSADSSVSASAPPATMAELASLPVPALLAKERLQAPANKDQETPTATTMLAPQVSEQIQSASADLTVSPKQAITALQPYMAEERVAKRSLMAPTPGEWATASSMNWDRLEEEVARTLGKVVGQSGYALPQYTQGLVHSVKNLVSAQQAESLLRRLEDQDYVHARDVLNKIVDEQTQKFLEWRRQFGQFSRLFAVVTLNEDVLTSFKAIKKAIELDPQECWNWLMMAQLAHQIPEEATHRLRYLEHALSVAVSGQPNLARTEALQRLPQSGAEATYLLILRELASLFEAANERQETINILINFSEYFRAHPPQTNEFRDHHLLSLLKLAELERLEKHMQRTWQLLQEALDLPYCQGQNRLKALLGLIDLQTFVNLPLEQLEKWFHEASALLLSFPQYHAHGAKYYRTLGRYHIHHRRYDLAEQFLQIALKLDRDYQQKSELIEDLHESARIAQALHNDHLALNYWQEANGLIAQITDANLINPSLVADIWLSLAGLFMRQGQYEQSLPFIERSSGMFLKLPPSLPHAIKLHKIADELFARAHYPSAQNAYGAALTLYRTTKNPLEMRTVQLAVAHCEFFRERFADAEKSLMAAKALLNEYPDPLLQTQWSILYGLIQEALQSPAKAVVAAQSALRSLSTLPSERAPADVLRPLSKTIHALLGRSLAQMGHPSSIDHLRQAMSFAESTPINPEWVELEKSLAQAMLEQRQYASALELLEIALVHAGSLNHRQLQWELTILLADALTQMQAFDRAEGLLRQVHEQARMLANPTVMANNCAAFGDYYAKRGQMDTAVGFFQQAIEHYRKARQPLKEALLKVRCAKTYINAQQIVLAQKMLQESLPILQSCGATRQCAEATVLFAKTLLKTNRAEEAEKAYQNAVALFEANDQSERAASELASLGILRLRQGKIAAAKEDWYRAHKMFEQLGNTNALAQINAWLDMVGEESA